MKPYSIDLRVWVLEEVDRGVTPEEVAEAFSVSNTIFAAKTVTFCQTVTPIGDKPSS